MINKIKRFISRYVDRPIYKGEGVTTTDVDSAYIPIFQKEIFNYRLVGTDDVFTVSAIEFDTATYIEYIYLNHTENEEHMKISMRLFKTLFICKYKE